MDNRKRSRALRTWGRRFGLAAGSVALLALGVGLGLWAGRDAGGRDTSPAESAGPDRSAKVLAGHPAASPETAPSIDPIPDLAHENRRLEQARQTLQQQYNDLTRWILDNVRGKFPVPDRLVGAMRLTPMNPDLNVNRDLVELLNLEPEEVAMLQDAMHYTLGSLYELEQALVRVESINERQAVLRVPPYPEQGQAAKEDLYLALEATLGPARMDRLVDVTEEEMARQFNHFGQGDRTLAFEVIDLQDEGIPPYLLIRDTWVLSEGDSVRKSEITETAVFTVPPGYETFLPWLPETFAPYASP